ncbi:hypothetical protein BV22DRAFT_718362 [Leucogyrophana mollusca]|uniref:Uncharacterized protein n=1 Tax=Leucogyrophana mollusca TaxID=85980 RepID=A0ACB8B7D5_9AGAM|nr:hypothetical protein BV22DRAFT_718362 [Leucogyrophana mollusca]
MTTRYFSYVTPAEGLGGDVRGCAAPDVGEGGEDFGMGLCVVRAMYRSRRDIRKRAITQTRIHFRTHRFERSLSGSGPGVRCSIDNACVRVEGPQPLAQWHSSRKKVPLPFARLRIPLKLGTTPLRTKHQRHQQPRKLSARPLTISCVFRSHHIRQIVSPSRSDSRSP